MNASCMGMSLPVQKQVTCSRLLSLMARFLTALSMLSSFFHEVINTSSQMFFQLSPFHILPIYKCMYCLPAPFFIIFILNILFFITEH